MIIETQYNIGEKIEINSYDKDDKHSTITSMDIKMMKKDELEITYWYKRDKSCIKGRFAVVEDGKGNYVNYIW
jgi:hypothetical protein